MSLDDDAAWRPPSQPSTAPPNETSAASGIEILPGYDSAVEIARGGDSIVYRARQRALGREVAVKVVLVTDATTLARFERELDITARLGRQHPNIVTVIDTGVTQHGQPAIVMDLIERGSTHDVLVAGGPFPVADVVRVGIVIADALSFAHSQGVLHRDVKPQNILVLPTSYVLTDFGISRLADSGHTASVERFSYRHAAPQVLDGEKPTVADDIWSLGSTLLTLLDGRAPFASDDPSDDSALAYLRRARTEEPRPLQRADVPDGLREVIARCLRKDPLERYPSAEELHRALVLVESDIRTWAAPAAIASPTFPDDAPDHAPDAADSGALVHEPSAPAEVVIVLTSEPVTDPELLADPDPSGEAPPAESSVGTSFDQGPTGASAEQAAWGLPAATQTTGYSASTQPAAEPVGAANSTGPRATPSPAPEPAVSSGPQPAASGGTPEQPSKSALAHQSGGRGSSGTARTPDAEPTGLAPSGEAPTSGPGEPGEPATDSTPRRASRRRILAGLLLGVGIGAAITLLQVKGKDEPVRIPATTPVVAGPGVPTTTLPTTGVTAAVPAADPRIAPVFVDVKPHGTSVDLEWTDRSDGKALFLVTLTGGAEPIALRSFPPGTTKGSVDLPDPNAPRVCLVIAATTGSISGVSQERCFDPSP